MPSKMVAYGYDNVSGYVPWALQQDQRGPTCGLTTIAVAYRILTGYTVFPTKGNYRSFTDFRDKVKLTKGNENILSIREAAKLDQVTAAGEIVNAADLVKLVNDHAEGVQARVVEVEGPDFGASFLEGVRKAISSGLSPMVLYYVDGRPTVQGHDNPDILTLGRQYSFQHWVNIVAVEDGMKWLQVPMVHVTGFQPPLTLKVAPKANQVLIWTWGQPMVVDGLELGKASAISIDWVTEPRLWTKPSGNPGQLNWIETAPDAPGYAPDKTTTVKEEVRYTAQPPSSPTEARGFAVMAAT